MTTSLAALRNRVHPWLRHMLVALTAAATLPASVGSAYAAPPDRGPSPPACDSAAAPARPALESHNTHCAPHSVPAEPAPTPAPPAEPEVSPEPTPVEPAPEEPAPVEATPQEPAPEEPAGAPEPAPAPAPASCVLATTTAGPFVITRINSTTLAIGGPNGGLNQATQLSLQVNGTRYGFERGYTSAVFAVRWSDREVRVEGWTPFAGRTVTSAGFVVAPATLLFGGWHDFAAPISMVDDPAC